MKTVKKLFGRRRAGSRRGPNAAIYAGRGKEEVALRRGMGLRFGASLVLVLLVVLVALEWKSYDPPADWNLAMDVEDLLDQPVPVTKLEVKLPPPPVAPDVIEVIENEQEIEETVLLATEANQEEQILEVDDIVVDKVVEDEEIPIAVVDEVPVFPGCEGAKDKRACFNEKVQEHIRKHFRYPGVAQEMGVQGRVAVLFTIGKDGSIGDIRQRGPDRSLEAEALRIIGKLPKMTPGKQLGRPVRVSFSLPILFRLQ